MKKMNKIQLIERLSKPALDSMGITFTSEQLLYCDVPVFKVLTPENIVVFREGNWSEFPFKELQQKLGKGLDAVSVNYISSLNTTVIVFADPGPITHFEKQFILNGTGEEFSFDICECEYLRPPFRSILAGEI